MRTPRPSPLVLLILGVMLTLPVAQAGPDEEAAAEAALRAQRQLHYVDGHRPFSSLEVSAGGAVHVAFGGAGLFYAEGPYSAPSSVPVDISARVETVSLALDRMRNPHVAYIDESTGALKYAHRVGASWLIDVVDGTGNAGGYASIAVALPGGQPHISYYDAANMDLLHATWTGSAWVSSVVDSVGDVGRFNSIALDRNGLPQIAYHDRTRWDLKHARWNGTSWVVATVDSPGVLGVDVALAVDAGGRSHISYADWGSGSSGLRLKYAIGTGTSWSRTHVDTAGDAGLATSIAVDRRGSPTISYLGGIVGGGTGPRVVKLASPSRTGWSIVTVGSARSPRTVLEWAENQTTSLAIDGRGALFLTYFRAPVDQAGDMQAGLTLVADVLTAARTYVPLDESLTAGLWSSSLSVHPSFPPRVTYADGERRTLMHAEWNGSEWTRSTVAGPGQVGRYSSLVVDAGGYSHVSYLDSSLGHLKYAKFDGTSWTTSVIDGSGRVGARSSLDIDPGRRLHACYHDGVGRDLKYAVQNGAGWTLSTVDAAGDVGSDCSLKVDATGNPHIAYWDNTKKDLKYARWVSPSWQVSVVDGPGDVGYDPSLVLDAGGNPHIAYYDATNGDLKYARWTRGAWSLARVDSLGNVGRGALALDANDDAHISYYNHSARDLKYARSTSGSWTVATVDAVGEVGLYSSIAIDPTGKPNVIYWSWPMSALKFWSP